ncbi:hypothetical protein PoB_007712900 [Plakobranchus ocellatus]|uniref:C2H2-type domain-containing protein n=1 Tax=Plakobranchus ocellatus TaxID=259542 RepID=A0AAV4E385_9GAST|nr:hypothetical protein PoB_007712900 [Plakobranchus ocellatus]
MPKEKEITNHPCHLLSLPSAKRFWCRHCMSVFEDAITRWRHSRSCRYGVVNNFMKRRELEAKALQNTTVLNPVEARLEQSIQMSDLASGPPTVQVKDENGVEILSSPEDFTCFICHKKFQSMEEMRHHVKYPCNASKIVTTRVPHPKHSMPVFIESLPPRQPWDQTQSIEIQQQPSYIHEHTYQPQQQLLEQHMQAGGSVEVKMHDSNMEQSFTSSTASYESSSGAGTSSASSGQERGKSLTPTTIYVNEKGETVIEVENLDLASDGGELSLAHLLTQLSQQGIVFDKSRSTSLQPQDFVLESQGETSGEQQQEHKLYKVEAQDHGMGIQAGYHQNMQVQDEVVTGTETLGETTAAPLQEEEEEGQPTAEDAANTLAQLAGFRGFVQQQKQQQDVAGHGTVVHNMQPTETQAVEMIQLSDHGTTSLPVHTYHYTNPVTIHYTSHSTGQQQQQQHTQVVGAQHMTLQEALSAAGSATQLYADAEVEAEDAKPAEYTELESVRYVVDPVTGQQVMQQVEENSELGSDLYQQEQSAQALSEPPSVTAASEHHGSDTTYVDHAGHSVHSSVDLVQESSGANPDHQSNANVEAGDSGIKGHFSVHSVSFQGSTSAIPETVANSFNRHSVETVHSGTTRMGGPSPHAQSLHDATPSVKHTQSNVIIVNPSPSILDSGSRVTIYRQDVVSLADQLPGCQEPGPRIVPEHIQVGQEAVQHAQGHQMGAYHDLEEDIPAQPIDMDIPSHSGAQMNTAGAVPGTDFQSEVIMETQGTTDIPTHNHANIERDTQAEAMVKAQGPDLAESGHEVVSNTQAEPIVEEQCLDLAESGHIVASDTQAEAIVEVQCPDLAESGHVVISDTQAETMVEAQCLDLAEPGHEVASDTQAEAIVGAQCPDLAESAHVVVSESLEQIESQPMGSVVTQAPDVNMIEPHVAVAAESQRVIDSDSMTVAVTESEQALDMNAESMAMINPAVDQQQHQEQAMNTLFVVTSTGIQPISRSGI